MKKKRIEISFNDSLDKNFVKDLSSKLYDWTNERWIISFSKIKGEMSIKEKRKNEKIKLIEEKKKTVYYKQMIDSLPDAELVDVQPIKKKELE